MPYKFDKLKLKIPEKHDKRRKLSEAEKLTMQQERGKLGTSYSLLGEKYGCSKRMAYFICNPEKMAENVKLRNEKGGSKQYYDKEKNTENVRKTRLRRKELYLKGELE